jgi:hypothetical protein
VGSISLRRKESLWRAVIQDLLTGYRERFDAHLRDLEHEDALTKLRTAQQDIFDFSDAGPKTGRRRRSGTKLRRASRCPPELAQRIADLPGTGARLKAFRRAP